MDFKQKSILTLTAKAAVPERNGEKLSIASLKELAPFLPDIDTEKNGDLLCVCFNGAVVNRANKNGDIMSTSVALEMVKTFINKPINDGHNRTKNKGVILNYGFSEFGTNKPLTEDEVKELTSPFNITLGGVIWRVVDSNLADYIEVASTPGSSCYSELCTSWEVGFNDNTILVTENGDKDLNQGIVIGPEDINFERYSNALIMNGGTGKVDDFYVYRNILSPALALGIGLTENPAADVIGVLTRAGLEAATVAEDLKNKEDSEEDKKCEKENCDCDKCKEEKETSSKCDKDELKAKLSEVINSDTNKETLAGISNIVSDLKEFEKSLPTVIKLTVMNSENTIKTTMLTSFADINEEFLKTAQANELREFLEKQVAESAAKASEQLKAEKSSVEAEKAAIAAELEAIKAQYEDAKKQLEALVCEKALATAQELFSKRMGYFDEKFELATEDKQIIAKVLKEVKDDEAFATYQKDMDVLLKGKEKGKQAVASVTEVAVVVNEEKILSKALDNATAEVITVTAGAPTQDEPKSLFDKYRKAFEYNKENFANR